MARPKTDTEPRWNYTGAWGLGVKIEVETNKAMRAALRLNDLRSLHSQQRQFESVVEFVVTLGGITFDWR